MEVANQTPMRAPKSIMYGDQLPLGVEAKSQKRMFFPTTGDTYTPTSNSICRIDINYDGLLDTAQSFLEFDLTNTSGRVASFDLGQPVIKKLTISSGGVVLEEIHDYNQLVGGVLFPSQSGLQNLHYESINNNGLNQLNNHSTITAANAPCAVGAVVPTPAASAIASLGTNAAITAELAAAAETFSDRVGPLINTAVDDAVGVGVLGTTNLLRTAIDAAVALSVEAGVNHSANNGSTGGGDVLRYANPTTDGATTTTSRTGVFADDGVFRQHYKLVSGLMDNDKYLPLVLMNAGITLEFELAPSVDCMVTNAAGASDYKITNVRYVAHLIDLERSFYDRLRMVQQNSGGVLQIAGQSWRGFRATQTAGATTQTLNCPARVRSIKSFFWKYSRAGNVATYNLSGGSNNDLTSFQLSIGATRYPPTANEVSALTNKVGAYTELQKAFGKVGSNVHPDRLNAGNYLRDNGDAPSMGVGQIAPFCPYGIDLESFRHEIENGIDTSSRALPISLHTQSSVAPDAGALDCLMWVLYDSLFYINMDGSVSVSS